MLCITLAVLMVTITMQARMSLKNQSITIGVATVKTRTMRICVQTVSALQEPKRQRLDACIRMTMVRNLKRSDASIMSRIYEFIQ